MASIGSAIGDMVTNTVAFIVLIILAVFGFFFVTFVVMSGAGLAGVDVSGDYVVLSAALIVAATVLGGARMD